MSNSEYIESVRGGLIRGSIVQFLVTPLDVMKTRQQAANIGLVTAVQQGSLYSGLSARCVQMVLRQSWTWPLITHLPPQLPFSSTGQQVATGVTIAGINACILAPIDKARVQLQLKERVSWTNNWSGAPAIFLKNVSGWTSFMVAQHYFRGKRKLTNVEAAIAGCKTAAVVTACKAPFDWYATLKQSSIQSATKSNPFIGSPLAAASILINNIASLILLNYLHKEKEESLDG